jgi:hypothetical protein
MTIILTVLYCRRTDANISVRLLVFNEVLLEAALDNTLSFLRRDRVDIVFSRLLSIEFINKYL